jgi:hypothetical protein
MIFPYKIFYRLIMDLVILVSPNKKVHPEPPKVKTLRMFQANSRSPPEIKSENVEALNKNSFETVCCPSKVEPR